MREDIEGSPGNAATLAACGGFLDAFTYLGHGHVFANAMSGNVVLLGIFAAGGNRVESLNHFFPIVAFLLGVGVAQAFRLPTFLKRVSAASLTCLGLEILFLPGGGFFPQDFGGRALVPAISFVAALQSSTFRRGAMELQLDDDHGQPADLRRDGIPEDARRG